MEPAASAVPPVVPPPVAAQSRRQRGLLPLAALLLVMILGAGAWWGHQAWKKRRAGAEEIPPSAPLVVEAATAVPAPDAPQPSARVAGQGVNALGKHSEPGKDIDAHLEIGLYAKREMADRQQWLGRCGGTPQSEQAVKDGLEWLARHQATAGFWSDHCLGKYYATSRCEKDSPCRDFGNTYEMAQTGLPLLAFQAGGHCADANGPYADVVRKGLDWLVAHQRDDGALLGSRSVRNGILHRYFMYEHGIATFALADACAVARDSGRTPDPRYHESLRRAVHYIEERQHDDGGWRYTEGPREASDTSVTGWQVLALQSAREAGIEVSQRTIDRVRGYFESRQAGAQGRTNYFGRTPGTDAMTGVGMLARQFLLDDPDAPLIREAAKYLAGRAVGEWGGPRKGSGDYYLWYNCGLAMSQVGGPLWEQWNNAVRDTISGLQRHDGCSRGSWDPAGRGGDEGGRIISTALAILTLEVYYRYTSPEERRTGTVGLNAREK